MRASCALNMLKRGMRINCAIVYLCGAAHMKRLIGRYTGSRPGALVIVIAALHGNEPAGVLAVKEVFRLLALEPQVNPDFVFSGRLVGLIGNTQAYQIGQRFIEQDLNRMWTPLHLRCMQQTPLAERQAEWRELGELLAAVQEEVLQYKPKALVVLDLHTTSANGGVFCIPTDDKASLRLAKELHAPVVLGMLDGLQGTLLHHVAGNRFEIGGYPYYSVGVAFEAGQHEDPESVSRAIAAVIHTLRAVGCVRAEDVDSRHEWLLRAFSATLPKVTRLRHVHHIRPGDAFGMRPGYVNFQPVRRGEHLADDASGPIFAPEDGYILMPLYQPIGSDGFFIVQELKN